VSILLETKNLGDRLIQLINNEILNTSPPYLELEKEHEEKIRSIVHMAFREGYGDCLKDVREGLIK